jgi:hypothetical protein
MPRIVAIEIYNVKYSSYFQNMNYVSRVKQNMKKGSFFLTTSTAFATIPRRRNV